ncbi:MAG: 3-deoxy-manno-octulosonate cytidylyltransferase [Gemmatimonadales bacterium]
MPVLGVIPARLGSTRLRNKPLQLLAGEPLVTRVIQRVRSLGLVDTLIVATDSTMIVRIAELSGVRAVLTSEAHESGTERVAEVGRLAEFGGHDVIVNIQGDEPFLPRAALAGAIERVRGGEDIGTAAAPLDAADVDDPSRVKVVTDERGRALYFSRAPIPFRRDASATIPALYWQHLGVYAFSRGALERWSSLSVAPAEAAERLEQLRALHHGMTIGVARLDAPAQHGVDTPDDLRRAEAHWFRQES